MNIVLVSIGNFQEYILTNIKQLIRLNHKKIYVITNLKFFDNFSEYNSNIHLIDASTLEDKFQYTQKTHMNINFRNAFWVFTSSRFFYIYAFMKKYEIQDVVHLENDVPIYYNCDKLIPFLKSSTQQKLFIPMDSYNRAIASIVYIPNAEILEKILELYEYNKNDMENFSIISYKIPDFFDKFPICISDHSQTDEEYYVTKNFEKFGFIFDAAAIGQYLGGVDPQNISGDTTGFINETCVIKYDRYNFQWEIDEIDNIRRPFLITEDLEKIQIFNLHIHCKNLEKFI
jgi:hypothetical protein